MRRRSTWRPAADCCGQPVRFNAEYCALRFHASALIRPIEDADPERARRGRAAAAVAGKIELVKRTHRALRLAKTRAGAGQEDWRARQESNL